MTQSKKFLIKKITKQNQQPPQQGLGTSVPSQETKSVGLNQIIRNVKAEKTLSQTSGIKSSIKQDKTQNIENQGPPLSNSSTLKSKSIASIPNNILRNNSLTAAKGQNDGPGETKLASKTEDITPKSNPLLLVNSQPRDEKVRWDHMVMNKGDESAGNNESNIKLDYNPLPSDEEGEY